MRLKLFSLFSLIQLVLISNLVLAEPPSKQQPPDPHQVCNRNSTDCATTTASGGHTGLDVNCIGGCSGGGSSTVNQGAAGAFPWLFNVQGPDYTNTQQTVNTTVMVIGGHTEYGLNIYDTFLDQLFESASDGGPNPCGGCAGIYSFANARSTSPTYTHENGAGEGSDDPMVMDLHGGLHVHLYDNSGNEFGLVGNPAYVVVNSITAALPAGTNVIGHVIVDIAPTTAVTGTFWQTTQPVSSTQLPASLDGANLKVHEEGTASVTFTNSTIAVTGAFYQSTQPVSGASGSFVSGSLADGSIVTLGSKADASNSATDTTAITGMQVLKEISKMVQNIPSQGAATTSASTPVNIASDQTVPIKMVRGTTVSSSRTTTGDFTVMDMTNYSFLEVEASGGTGAQVYFFIETVNPPGNNFSPPAYPLPGGQAVAFIPCTTGSYYILNVSTFVRPSLLAISSGTCTLKMTPILGPMPSMFPSGNVTLGSSSNTIGSLIANQSVNLAQVGGNTVATGTGVSGNGIPRVTVSNDSNVLVTPPTLTSGTQGSTGFSVQALSDAGRTYITLRAQKITGVTTEALATFTKNVGGTDTTGQTAYTITNNKTFVIQSITAIIFDSTTTANDIIVNVRAAGSVSASSPIVLTCGASSYAALATSIGVQTCVAGGNGIFIPGNGTIQLGISHLENVTTASIASFTMVGYEF